MFEWWISSNQTDDAIVVMEVMDVVAVAVGVVAAFAFAVVDSNDIAVVGFGDIIEGQLVSQIVVGIVG